MGSQESLAEAARAMDALRQVVRALRLSSAAAEREAGISSAQLFVLQKLKEGSPRSVGELARATLTDPSSVSVVVSRLVARGLVTRASSASDVRRAAIALTRQGSALTRRAPQVAQDELFAAFARLPAALRGALADGLSALVAEMRIEGTATLFFEDDAPSGPPSPSSRPRARPAPSSRPASVSRPSRAVRAGGRRAS